MAPYASRVPFQLMLAPRNPRGRAFEDDGADRGRTPARRALSPGANISGRAPPFEPLGPYGAARGRSLLLADRRLPHA